MSDIKDWDTDYILKECREQMQDSCDRCYYIDELAGRIESLRKQLEVATEALKEIVWSDELASYVAAKAMVEIKEKQQ